MNIQKLVALPRPDGMPDWQWLDTRVQLILMMAGSKQAISIATKVGHSLEQLASDLTEFGLYCNEAQKIIHGYVHLHVGITDEASKLLAKALSGTLPIKEANIIHGDLSGFPSTAIVAFNNDNLMEPEEFSSRVRQSQAYIFGTFRYSRDHWKDELIVGEEWAKINQAISPHIYTEYLRTFTVVRNPSH